MSTDRLSHDGIIMMTEEEQEFSNKIRTLLNESMDDVPPISAIIIFAQAIGAILALGTFDKEAKDAALKIISHSVKMGYNDTNEFYGNTLDDAPHRH